MHGCVPQSPVGLGGTTLEQPVVLSHPPVQEAAVGWRGAKGGDIKLGLLRTVICTVPQSVWLDNRSVLSQNI